MTELEEVAAQIKLFAGKTVLTQQEVYELTQLQFKALRLRVADLEIRVNILEDKVVELDH